MWYRWPVRTLLFAPPNRFILIEIFFVGRLDTYSHSLSLSFLPIVHSCVYVFYSCGVYCCIPLPKIYIDIGCSVISMREPHYFGIAHTNNTTKSNSMETNRNKWLPFCRFICERARERALEKPHTHRFWKRLIHGVHCCHLIPFLKLFELTSILRKESHILSECVIIRSYIFLVLFFGVVSFISIDLFRLCAASQRTYNTFVFFQATKITAHSII